MGIVMQGEYNSTTQSQTVSGKFAKLQVDSDSNLMVAVASTLSCRLRKGNTPSIILTCTNANTNYEASAAMPAGTRYIAVYSSASFILSIGEATSATVGIQIEKADLIPVKLSGVAADDKINVQSPTAGATVRITYLQD